jgi:hypothetical protein
MPQSPRSRGFSPGAEHQQATVDTATGSANRDVSDLDHAEGRMGRRDPLVVVVLGDHS